MPIVITKSIYKQENFLEVIAGNKLSLAPKQPLSPKKRPVKRILKIPDGISDLVKDLGSRDGQELAQELGRHHTGTFFADAECHVEFVEINSQASPRG